ncbi:DUF3949 domain-containing protein [Neobacillus sp. PS3-40]|uniref:DUF3949 domain-containing protein n=1 Tax=Neobacillus sp. PS3-40 TaxID=3070679 RepID=UPI0027DF733E|nr:DUF3949 domain-containing protein [Neobacillus sp. PS3-40]WML42905.1 DUF3949 domain-containing protein [Neobacillus sp. PS3-40]
MGLTVTLWVLGGYILLSLLFLPFQYSYVKELKEMDKKRKEQGLSQEEMYDKMSFEEQELNFHVQGSILFIGANLFASLLYNWKHKNMDL